MRARQLGGEVKYLSQGEIEAHNRGYSPYSVETWRSWDIGRTRPAAATYWPGPTARTFPRQKPDRKWTVPGRRRC
jgi:hypothetical protein